MTTSLAIGELIAGAERGDRRLLARCLTAVERGALTGAALAGVCERRGSTPLAVIGFTGSPGVGKSTLVDAAIAQWRESGDSVAVLAIDPSSARTGGAILGDRIRMQRHALDLGVFVRSMSNRAATGGLTHACREALAVFGGFGFDRVVVETVGAGQSEIAVQRVADVVVVVMSPANGDSVQISKSGILEIADVFAVNKADLPGAPVLARELRILASIGDSSVKPAVVQTIAADGRGVGDLVTAIDAHLQRSPPRPLAAVAADSAKQRTLAFARDQVGEQLRALLEADPIVQREMWDEGPAQAARTLVERLAAGQSLVADAASRSREADTPPAPMRLDAASGGG